MTRNEQIPIHASAQRAAVALESIAVSANTIANGIEEIRVELKKKRFDDAEFATFEKET
jgi:uncharacterized protein YaaN involved in tellurite resistance